MKREAQVKEAITAVFQQEKHNLEGYKVFLFGSRATNHAKPRSDFDVGIIGDRPLDSKLFSVIEDKLDNLPVLYKIDLVDFSKVSERFKKEALKTVEDLL